MYTTDASRRAEDSIPTSQHCAFLQTASTFLMVKLASGSLARGLTQVLHENQMFGVQGVVALAFDLSTEAD